MSIKELKNKIQDIEVALSSNPDPTTKKKLEQGLSIFNDLLLAEQQKKTENQPIEKIEQLPKEIDIEAGLKEIANREWPKIREKLEAQEGGKKLVEELEQFAESNIPPLPSDLQSAQSLLDKWAKEGQIKTIKAPAIDREPEYINIELTDQKGKKYIRTYNRAQTKALCRKYFSNVHNAWVGGNRKLTNGFDNLLAFFLGWAEFDGKTPGLQDVLQDYFRYKKASEKSEDSEAFKAAKKLYDKIILVTSKESPNEA